VAEFLHRSRSTSKTSVQRTAARSAARSPRRSNDRLGQGLFVETERGVAVDETTVDDDSRQAANAVTGGCHCDGGIVHVANFDIVLGARQKLDQFHSLGAARATSCKDLDFSALSHVVPPGHAQTSRSSPLWLAHEFVPS
jgi:hypothetical protein